MRREGDWTEVASGRKISSQVALEFDRFLYGYIPSFRWIGEIGGEETEEPDKTVTIQTLGPFRCTRYRWVIHWLSFGLECGLFGLGLFFFLRKRARNGVIRKEG
jgi:hypothetical protein